MPQNITCYWTNVTGTGEGLIYGNVYNDSLSSSIIGTWYHYGYLVTPISSPINTSSVNISIRYSFTYFFDHDGTASALPFLEAIIIDPSTNDTLLQYSASISNTSGFTWLNTSQTLSQEMASGKTYYLLVGIYIYVVWLNLFWSRTTYYNLTFYLFLDKVFLNVSSEYYIWSGNAVNINTSRTVYATLIPVGDWNLSSGTNITIRLTNAAGLTNTSIVIVNGSVVSENLNWTRLDPIATGYSSGALRIDVSKTNQTNSTLSFMVKLCYGGPGASACIYYPVSILIDPRGDVIANIQLGEKPQSLAPHPLVQLHKKG